jgi:hypothetical protein
MSGENNPPAGLVFTPILLTFVAQMCARPSPGAYLRDLISHLRGIRDGMPLFLFADMKNKPTKKSLKETCRLILHSYEKGHALNQGHEAELLPILMGHPEWDEKSAPGIRCIFVGADGWGSRCFWLSRIDGTYTDISFNAAIDGKKSKRADVLAAMRHAIRGEIQAFRSGVRFSEQLCPFTGEALFPSNTHIDHYDMKFSEVAAAWLDGKDLEAIWAKTNHKSADGDTETRFTDFAIAEDFIRFHNANTHLRAVSAHANLSILK